jgi:5-methylcytosine-specific restriction endonuclease McrA
VSARHRPHWLKGAAGVRFRRALTSRHNHRCFYCRRGFAHHDDVTLDHFIPRLLWPRCTARENFVPACRDCNEAKGHTLPVGLVWALLRMVSA